MENIKISCTIIAKNEEGCIEKCLKSIQGVDEIIVLDTGSTDKTMEIARKYTDNVYQDLSFYTGTPGVDGVFDFAGARNKCKEYANNDWVLSIDCDEELITEGGIEKIKEIIKNNSNIDSIGIDLWGGGDSHCYGIRVFKKEKIWYGKIHETIQHSIRVNSDVCIKYGVSPTHQVDIDLDLRILKKEYEDNPTNTRIMFYYGRELYYKGFKDKRYFDEAKKILEERIKYKVYFEEETHAYYLLAQCYWYDGQSNGDKAREYCLKAIWRNPHFKKNIELMAHMSFEREKKRWLEFAEKADNSKTLFTN